MNAKELGEAVKRKRIGEHLSLRLAAGKLRLSASTLSKIELGHGFPDTGTLAKLSDWLGGQVNGKAH
jgi:transcriptional regulator with XRE-family HTH domain